MICPCPTVHHLEVQVPAIYFCAVVCGLRNTSPCVCNKEDAPHPAKRRKGASVSAPLPMVVQLLRIVLRNLVLLGSSFGLLMALQERRDRH